MFNIRRFYQQSIQVKLTIWFLAILIPLVFVSLISNWVSEASLKRQVNERMENSLHSAVGYMSIIMSNLESLIYSISIDRNIESTLLGIQPSLTTDNLYDLHIIMRQLTNILSVNRHITDIVLLQEHSRTALSWRTNIVRFDNVTASLWYQRVMENKGGIYAFSPQESDLAAMPDFWQEDHIYFMRQMNPLKLSNEPAQIVMVAIPTTFFAQIIDPLIPSRHSERSLTFKGEPILGHGFSVQELPPGSITITTGPHVSGWELTIHQPESDIMQTSYQVRYWTYVLIALSIALAFLVSLLVYSGIAKPLSHLTSKMRLFSGGNRTIFVQHNRKDELGYAMDTFNQMVLKQQQLIEQVYEKELRLTASEFALLQSQINPHFLYNTLDCIYTVAEEHQIVEVSEMVMNLAMFFRVSLGKGVESFTMEETINHLMYYIRVQQIRMFDRVKVELHVDEAAKQLPLLKLLLQPIVENAFVHGLEKTVDQGVLTIHVTLTEAVLHILVADTGAGMQPELLEEIQQELALIGSSGDNPHLREPVKDRNGHFALKNVRARLLLYYGETADMSVQSKPEKGTQVTIRIHTNLLYPRTEEQT